MSRLTGRENWSRMGKFWNCWFCCENGEWLRRFFWTPCVTLSDCRCPVESEITQTKWNTHNVYSVQVRVSENVSWAPIQQKALLIQLQEVSSLRCHGCPRPRKGENAAESEIHCCVRVWWRAQREGVAQFCVWCNPGVTYVQPPPMPPYSLPDFCTIYTDCTNIQGDDTQCVTA